MQEVLNSIKAFFFIIGHYRVNYDTENWLKIAQYMNSSRYAHIHVLNRAQIIDDAFYFFMHNQLDYIIFWKICEFLSRETNYIVWYPMFKAFEYMTLLTPIDNAENLKVRDNKFVRKIKIVCIGDSKQCNVCEISYS